MVEYHREILSNFESIIILYMAFLDLDLTG